MTTATATRMSKAIGITGLSLRGGGQGFAPAIFIGK